MTRRSSTHIPPRPFGPPKSPMLALAAALLIAAIAAFGIGGARTAEAGGDHGGEADLVTESIRSTEITFSISNHPGQWWVRSQYHENSNLEGCIKAEPGNQTAVITGLPANRASLNFEPFFKYPCVSANRLLNNPTITLYTNPVLNVSSGQTTASVTFKARTADWSVAAKNVNDSTDTACINVTSDTSTSVTFTVAASPGSNQLTAGQYYETVAWDKTGCGTVTGASKISDANFIEAQPTGSILGLNGWASDQSYIKDQAITTLSLSSAWSPSASPTITYALDCGTPDLPAGLSFNTSNRQLTGTPTSAGTSTCTYTASAANHTSAQHSFDIVVRAEGLTSSDVTATTAKLTLVDKDLSNGAKWWYSSDDGTTCLQGKNIASGIGVANATALAMNASHTFKAYAETTCTTAIQTAAALTTALPALGVSSITHNSATLTLSNWTLGTDSSDWYYMRTTPSGGTCTESHTASVTLTNLTTSTPYVFKAYTHDDCGVHEEEED